MVVWHWRTRHSPLPQEQAVVVAVCTCMVDACSSINWLLQLPGAVLLIGRAPFVYWGVSNYCALTEVFLLPRIQLCSLHRLSWLLLPHDYRHDYFLSSDYVQATANSTDIYTNSGYIWTATVMRVALRKQLNTSWSIALNSTVKGQHLHVTSAPCKSTSTGSQSFEHLQLNDLSCPTYNKQENRFDRPFRTLYSIIWDSVICPGAT